MHSHREREVYGFLIQMIHFMAHGNSFFSKKKDRWYFGREKPSALLQIKRHFIHLTQSSWVWGQSDTECLNLRNFFDSGQLQKVFKTLLLVSRSVNYSFARNRKTNKKYCFLFFVLFSKLFLVILGRYFKKCLFIAHKA